MTSRQRVLAIAEAANPEWTSVPLVGWSLVRALMDVADVHLLTQVRNREAIERTGLVEGRDFTALDTEAVAGPVSAIADKLGGRVGKAWTAGTALSTLNYYEFERQVWLRFGARIKSGEFGVVHRITPLSPVSPSLLARRCQRAGVPFVLGPLNGGAPWPKEFREAQHQEREWLSYVRSAYKLLPGYRSTRKYASAVIVGSRHTFELEPAWVHSKCVYLPENAIDPKRFNQQASYAEGGPLRVCFVGRLVPYKGPDMLVEAALPLLRSGKLTLDVVGDGPLTPRLKELTEGVPGVTLHGWVEHEKVQDVLSHAHVFGFPSIREFGGGAVLEAMALGVVPMIVDYAGPAELVTPETGIKIPLGNREEIIERLRGELEALTVDGARQRLATMAAAGRARVMSHFTWAAKAQQVLQIHAWVKGELNSKPDPMHA